MLVGLLGAPPRTHVPKDARAQPRHAFRRPSSQGPSGEHILKRKGRQTRRQQGRQTPLTRLRVTWSQRHTSQNLGTRRRLSSPVCISRLQKGKGVLNSDLSGGAAYTRLRVTWSQRHTSQDLGTRRRLSSPVCISRLQQGKGVLNSDLSGGAPDTLSNSQCLGRGVLLSSYRSCGNTTGFSSRAAVILFNGQLSAHNRFLGDQRSRAGLLFYS